MLDQSGFLLSGDSFVWTGRGLLKIRELKAGDTILGIVSGKPSWSTISLETKRLSHSKLVRITTDGNEVLVSPSCEVFTVGGVKKASSVLVGEILETYNIPDEIRELIDARNPSVVKSEAGPIVIDGKIAYVLGTQIKSPKHRNRIYIKDLNPVHMQDVARLCSEALKEQYLKHRIYYAPGRKLRIECDGLAEVCESITEYNIPPFVRESNATALRYFLCGVLDMIVITSEFEDPPTYYITSARQSEFRRFILNVLRLFGIIPVRTYVIHPSQGSTYMKTYIDPADLRMLGLKFIRTKDVPKFVRSQKGKPTSYCMIREVAEFHDRPFFLPEQTLHWSPIADMTPLHHHTLSDSP